MNIYDIYIKCLSKSDFVLDNEKEHVLCFTSEDIEEGNLDRETSDFLHNCPVVSLCFQRHEDNSQTIYFMVDETKEDEEPMTIGTLLDVIENQMEEIRILNRPFPNRFIEKQEVVDAGMVDLEVRRFVFWKGKVNLIVY